MKEIASSDSGSVSSIDCINQSSNIPKLTKTDAQKALDKFLESQWLKEACSLFLFDGVSFIKIQFHLQKEGEVSFTVRALLELEPLIKKIDDELGDCSVCGKLAVKV